MSGDAAATQVVGVAGTRDGSRGALRWAWQFFGIGRRGLLVSLLLGTGGALSALGLAALSAWLITRAWQMPPVLYLSVAITAVRALGISRGVFRYLERLATHDLALGAMATARERIYRALSGGAPGYSVTLRRGVLLARTGDDVDAVGDVLIRGVIPVGVGATTSVAAVVVMALVSPWAAAVLALSLLVSGGLAPWLAARGSSCGLSDRAAARDRVIDATTTALWHGPELVVARRRDEVLDDVDHAQRAEVRAGDRGARVQAMAAAATPLAQGVSLLAAAVIGVGMASSVSGSLSDVSSGHGLTPMTLGVVILLPLSAFESTGPLTEAGIAIRRGRQSAARLRDLVIGATPALQHDADPGNTATAVEFDADTDSRPGPVRMATASLRWGRTAALNEPGGLDLDLPPGARVAVTGPSGVGKSTLLLTIAGLLPPVSGSIACTEMGSEPVDLGAASVYFAEDGHLFATSVRENLLVADGAAAPARLEAAVAAVGLADWAAALPEGLDTVLEAGDQVVSGGQRRRLLLARAILSPAPVILLDEPTEHLDADSAADLLSEILDGESGMFAPGTTVLVATHDIHRSGIAMPTGAQVVDLAGEGSVRPSRKRAAATTPTLHSTSSPTRGDPRTTRVAGQVDRTRSDAGVG